MIKWLVLFGATGALAGHFLLPALAELYDAGQLPEGFRVVGAACEDWNDDRFRHHVALVRSLRYRKVDCWISLSARKPSRSPCTWHCRPRCSLCS